MNGISCAKVFLAEKTIASEDRRFMKLRDRISWLLGTLQRHLFPRLEECCERPLTDKEQQLVSILELLQIEKFVGPPTPKRCGRKLSERRAMARAFVGKAVYNHPTTRATREALRNSSVFRRICCFVTAGDIPSEATFSRAFAEFAEQGLGDRVHEALVKRCVKPQLVGHISRDATAIKGREKPVAKPPVAKPAPRKKGRPRRGEVREPKAPTRLERQCHQSAAEALAELPVHCDVGTKRNSQGHRESWRGYKLHADVNDCCLPISVALTAASVHDSQVAIPLMKTTSERVDYLYDLMDAAYDAQPIYEVSRTLNHVPIIDKNSRGRDIIPLAPHEAVRYQERSVAERFNGRLKEEFGARNVMVRGAKKVRLHLMFGVMALFADQVLKLIS
jgi:Transposase DDE domain/Transposase domain (DUF772)